MKLRIVTLFTFMAMLAFSPASHAQYQLLNPGFESWESSGVNARPNNWSSFPQADGSWAWAANTAQHYHRNGGRPGTAGSSYVTIYSRSVLGVVANGNMTTGQIHAGSTSASSSNNYNYTHRGSDYCHAFSGTPDSMYVWVSYYASSSTSQGSVRAYLHGNTDFKDPNDCSTASLYRGKAVAQFSRTTNSASSPTWVQQRVPFVYDGTSSVNYVLMSMTTNTTAGGGSANDSLSVDDIEFIYSAWLDDIKINGISVTGFQRDCFNYADTLANVSELNAATVSFTQQASDATVTVDTLWIDGLTRQFVLHVLAEDSVTSRTYTVTLTCPQSPCSELDSLVVSNIGFTNCTINIFSPYLSQDEDTAVEFQLLLQQGDATITDTVIRQTVVSFDNLSEGTTYQVSVRTLCDSTHQSGWTLATFTTLSDTTTIITVPNSIEAFRLYPNPANDRVCLELYQDKVQGGVLTLYDVAGRKVLQQQVDADGRYFEISHLPAGVFTAVLHIGGRVVAEQRLSIVR